MHLCVLCVSLLRMLLLGALLRLPGVLLLLHMLLLLRALLLLCPLRLCPLRLCPLRLCPLRLRVLWLLSVLLLLLCPLRLCVLWLLSVLLLRLALLFSLLLVLCKGRGYSDQQRKNGGACDSQYLHRITS
jgi:hypothetical protein